MSKIDKAVKVGKGKKAVKTVKGKKTASDILDEAKALKANKSKDYLGSEWSEEDYFPYGEKSFITLIWTKMLRIRSIMDVAKPNFEKPRDSLIDMINYAAMFVAWLDNKEDK